MHFGEILTNVSISFETYTMRKRVEEKGNEYNYKTHRT